MSAPERAVRWSTVAAVTVIAAVAGWVSYEHALAVVRAYGEAGMVAQVYPVTVDGLIYSASMVLLDSARRGVRAPALARWLLAAGIGATLAANVTAGLHFGPVGAVVAAWPALALVGSYELLMLIIRSGARSDAPAGAPEIRNAIADLAAPITQASADLDPAPDTSADTPEIRNGVSDLATLDPPRRGGFGPAPDASADTPDPVTVRAQLNGHAAKSEKAFAADLEAGRIPGLRRIQAQLHVGQPKARLVQEHLRNVIETK
ncbi:MAG TPA: DUF2637 domain-containing protein [Trebonia sp.]